MKRTFDFILSGILLILCGWVIGALAGLVRLTSLGPGILPQKRVGRSKKIFTCYKIRTMYVGTITAATHLTGPDAVTPIGKILRKYKLDELPQLWNVFKGDMSLVGPRPCLPIQRELIDEREKRGVFAVRPGITGRAQVLGVDMSNPEQLAEIDAEYLRKHSIVSDLAYITSTLFGRGFGDRIPRSSGGKQ